MAVSTTDELVKIDLDPESTSLALLENLRPLRIPQTGAPNTLANFPHFFTDTWDTLCLENPLTSAIFPETLLQIGDLRVTVCNLARTGSKEVEIHPIKAKILDDQLKTLIGNNLNPDVGIVDVGIVSVDGAVYRPVGKLAPSNLRTTSVRSRTFNGVIYCLLKTLDLGMTFTLERTIRDRTKSGQKVYAYRGDNEPLLARGDILPLDQSAPRLNNPLTWNTPLIPPPNAADFFL
jgi:hypothetical protein